MWPHQLSLFIMTMLNAGSAIACSINGGQLKMSIDDIPEQLPIGSVVAALKFDSPPSVRALHVVKPSQNFAFNPENYQLFVTAVLDIDENPSDAQPQHMQIRCDSIQGIHFEIDIWFYIMDINDNLPKFLPSKVYIFNVSEGLPIASEIGQLHATDADRDNLNIEYRIQSGLHSAFFRLQDKPDGYSAIKLAQTLDFETDQQMSLQVLAMDCSSSGCQNVRRTSTATVIINISDADDQNPEFVGTPYQATIFDNATAGSIVMQVRAIDLDATLNVTLQYNMIEDDNTKDIYDVHRSSGMVTIKNPKLLQKDFLYLLQLKVCQVNDPNKRDSTTVVIRVMAANGRAPRFDRKLYQVYLMEDSLVPMKVLTLAVKESETEERSLHFSMLPSNESAPFSIEQSSPHIGELFLREPLDYERRARYELTVKVSKLNQEDTTTVVIHVIDANDNNPQFDIRNYEFNVNSTFCGVVHASDKDEGTNLTYGILGGQLSELFIVTIEGVLTLKGSPQDYTSDIYFLTVLAMDNGIPPRTGAASVVLNLKPYLSLRSSAVVAQAGLGGGYLAYVLGAMAAALLAVVVILVVCLVRGSLRKPARSKKDGSKRPRPGDEEAPGIGSVDGCTYMAMSRISAEHVALDYPQAMESSLCDGSNCSTHRPSAVPNGLRASESRKAVHLQPLLPKAAAQENGPGTPSFRSMEEDTCSLLLPQPQVEMRQPYGCGFKDEARDLESAASAAGLPDSLLGKPLIGSHDGSSVTQANEWLTSSKPRGASTSSCSSRSSTAHTYEERSVSTAVGSSSTGNLPSQQMVMRKSSLLARGHAHGNSRPTSLCSGDTRSHRDARRQQIPKAGSPQQKRVLLRKKQLVMNKDSLLYGDMTEALDPARNMTPFTRQCTLAPSVQAVSRRKESNR